ncbi:hypothetical protein WJX72_000323 [[Myrmecia] bisecta]|uniref:Phosphoglycerate mutase-like protein n=1 Tax=[Myrmecia] bisecta TaxID=41462 RepID=A0AAW1PAK0_9CHLO
MHVPASPPSPSERRDPDFFELKRELQDLREQMAAQSQIIQAQGRTIDSLRGTLQLRPPSTYSGPVRSLSTAGTSTSEAPRPFDAQYAAIGDRRFLGMYDARFHSTKWGATPKDYRVLPRKIILVRHAESEGNLDNFAYTYVPDPQIPLTHHGHHQALAAGEKIKQLMEADMLPYNLFFYTSPYKRSRQTYEALSSAFSHDQIHGYQEEVQLREQDFGNFQDAEGKQREKAERLRFGRFFYRFPNGESGADVYDRMTIFEDHMIRDINAGRFSNNTSLVLVTHGLALRVFLMRWLHWSVDQFMDVFNPPNAEPLILERVPADSEARAGGPVSWIHTKALYRLTEESKNIIKGCTDEMCSTSCLPGGHKC